MGGHARLDRSAQTGDYAVRVAAQAADVGRAAALLLRAAAVAQRLDGDLAARQLVVAEDQRIARAAGVGLLELRLEAASRQPAACICTRDAARRAAPRSVAAPAAARRRPARRHRHRGAAGGTAASLLLSHQFEHPFHTQRKPNAGARLPPIISIGPS